MKRYTATEARRELFHILDAVERGEAVILERKGVRFGVVLESPSPPVRGPDRRLEIEDEDVLSGEWTWSADQDGQLEFRPRRTDQ